MHALAPYVIRVYNPALPGEVGQRYSKLDKIGQYDLFVLIREFINHRKTSFTMKDDSKVVYKFDSILVDEKSRTICGWMCVGLYGTVTDIININTGKVDHKKVEDNAEIIKHYFNVVIPSGVDEAICLMHSYRGNGVKTLFFEIFLPYFKKYVPLAIQMRPLAYEKALQSWKNGAAKEIHVKKFTGGSQIEDIVKGLGHVESEYTIKAKRKGSLGKLSDFFEKGSSQNMLLEILEGLGSHVKTKVDLAGRKRTFTIGTSMEGAVCQIDFDSNDVEMDGGMPKLGSMHNFAEKIKGEYLQAMYPFLGV